MHTQDRDVLELLSRIGKEEANRAKEAAYKAKGQLARRASSTGLQGLVPNGAQNGTADRTETQVENGTAEELAVPSVCFLRTCACTCMHACPHAD